MEGVGFRQSRTFGQNHALFGCLYAGLYKIGRTSVPMNMLILGKPLRVARSFRKPLPSISPFRRWLSCPLLVSRGLHSESLPGCAWAHRSLVYLVDMWLEAAPTANKVVAELVGEIKLGVVMCIILQCTWLSVHVVVATSSWLCDFSFVVVSSFRLFAVSWQPLRPPCLGPTFSPA